MNCIIVDDDGFSRTVIRKLVQRTPNLELLKECSSAIDAYQFLKKHRVDVVFLDVEMPEMNGIELLQSLERLPQIILITSGRQYAVEAFDYSATDYIVKPVDYPRFLKAVSKAEFNIERNSILQTGESDPMPTGGGPYDTDAENKDFFFVKTKADGKIVHLKLSDIVYIEALSDYARIHTANNSYVVHGTMKGLSEKLPANQFMRVHRSYIVNTSIISSITDDGIRIGELTIPIGASYKHNFIRNLNYLT